MVRPKTVRPMLKTSRMKKKSKDLEASLMLEEDNHIQSEYITNLQQQIYFLELELQVMKEKAASGRFAGGTGLSKNAPLDTHMNSLREKYAAMEKKYRKKMRDKEREVDDTQVKEKKVMMKLHRTEAELSLSKDRTDELEKQLESMNLEHVKKVVAKDHRIIDLEESLASKKKELDEKTASSQLKQTALLNTIDSLKSEIKEQKAKLEETTAEALLHERKRIAAQENESRIQEEFLIKDAEVVRILDELDKEKDIIRKLDTKTQTLELEMKAERDAATRSNALVANLREKYERQSDELKKIEATFKEFKASDERWRKKYNILDVDNESLQKKFETLTTEYEHLHTALTQEQEEKNTLIVKNEDDVDIIRRLEERQKELDSKIELLQKLRNDHETEAKIAIQDQSKAEQKLADFQADHDELVEKYEAVCSDFDVASKRLAVSTQLENIDLEQFTTLCSANLKIADSIKGLMSSLDKSNNRR